MKAKAMKYGVLNFNPDNASVPLTGKIACRLITASLQLRTEDRRGNENAPNYSVWAKEAGNVYQLGSAWVKRGVNGEFISITLDSPEMDAPLNVTAYPQKDDSSKFDIVWTRPRQDRKAAKAVDTPENDDSGFPA